MRPTPEHLRAPRGRCLLQLAVVLTVLGPAMSWVVPQPKANVWRTLARAMGQDHICLSQGSAQDPIASCLVGIPFQESELPPDLLKLKADFNSRPPPSDRQTRILPHPITNPLILWRDWVSAFLPTSPDEPQELELLGSSPSPICVQFVCISPKQKARIFTNPLQSKEAYYATPWCRQVAQVKMPSTPGKKPLSLPKGVFLICGDRAFTGIPSRHIGGPCTLGKLGLLSPNKTTIIDWIVKNSTQHATVKKRDLADLDPDCKSDVIHWSKAKATAFTVFLPWISVAKALGELGQLECWVSKQANLISAALSDLLRDEEITRKVTIQNRAAMDYLLLLNHHTCEEFEGLCCFNLSSRAEKVRTNIKKTLDMAQDIKKETKDWFDQLFGNWGLSGWDNSALKIGLLIMLILSAIGIGFGIIRKLTTRAISSREVKHVPTPTPSLEEIELQQFPPREEDQDHDFDSEDFIPEVEEEEQVSPTQQAWLREACPQGHSC